MVGTAAAKTRAGASRTARAWVGDLRSVDRPAAHSPFLELETMATEAEKIAKKKRKQISRLMKNTVINLVGTLETQDHAFEMVTVTFEVHPRNDQGRSDTYRAEWRRAP